MEGTCAKNALHSPESAGVDSRGILGWLNALEEAKLEMHGLVMLRHGKPIAKGWWHPYNPETPHILHSLSKSFTSTAVGFAVSEGLLTVEDPVASFFPDKLPGELTPHARAMKVKHLLMMGTGHKADFMDTAFARADGDWVRNFFEHPPEEAPGSLFVYNNMATYMCSAIVTKLTGLSVHDYLMPRLFTPLGMGNPYWTACPKGNSAGAFGLRLTTEQISCFGQFLLQKGMWEGRRLLPAAWIEEASGIRIKSAGSDDKEDEPANEWNSGYGYQFWKCLDGSYRADGAFGQICIVSERHDVVIAFNSGMNDVGKALGLVWAHIWPALSDGVLPENPDALAALRTRLHSLAIAVPEGDVSEEAGLHWQGKLLKPVSFTMEENTLQISHMELAVAGDVVTLEGRSPKGCFMVKGAFGRWEPGTANLFIGIAEAPGDAGAGYAAELADGSLQLLVQQLCGPASMAMNIRMDGDRLVVGGKVNATFGPTEMPVLEGIQKQGECDMGNDIPDKNLFMMCPALNPDAVADLPGRYHVRTCRRNELSIWKAMPFDDPKTAVEYQAYMTRYFHDVYMERESVFFEKCLFVCDDKDTPVGTCFAWKAYEKITTIHWYKVLKDYEGKGIGRALLSVVMKSLSVNDYPVYLHTQPSSFRAIKLYSDFGFAFLSDSLIGNRKNDLDECLPILKAHMPKADFDKLQYAKAPDDFLEAVKSSVIDQF